MRQTAWTLKRALWGVAGGMLALTLVLGAGSRAWAEDVEEEDTFEQKIIKQLLGVDTGKPPIDYRERSPLVVPPNPEELPPPDSGAAANLGPSWPNDPDVRRRAERAGQKRTADDGRPLSPDELRRGRTARRAADAPVSREPDERPGLPSEYGYRGGLWGTLFGGGKQEDTTFQGEAPRASLTEPPPGYRTPAPTAPYGPGEKDRGGPNILSVFDAPTQVR
jgi:hypothetical protein